MLEPGLIKAAETKLAVYAVVVDEVLPLVGQVEASRAEAAEKAEAAAAAGEGAEVDQEAAE